MARRAASERRSCSGSKRLESGVATESGSFRFSQRRKERRARKYNGMGGTSDLLFPTCDTDDKTEQQGKRTDYVADLIFQRGFEDESDVLRARRRIDSHEIHRIRPDRKFA